MTPWSPDDKRRLMALAPLGIEALRRGFPGRGDASLRSKVRSLGGRVPRTRTPRHYWRGNIPIPEHCHPLVKGLIAECNRQRVHLYEVAESAGVSRQQFSKWRYATTPHLVGLIAVANVLGLELTLRPMREDDDEPQRPSRRQQVEARP